MLRGFLAFFTGLACVSLTHLAMAQSYEIDPAISPGRARFMQLAQERFDEDHAALFQTVKPKPEDEQPVFECAMKAVLADIPDSDAAKAADIMEGKAEPDPETLKWFAFDKKKHPERYQQIISRAHEICPKYKELMK